MSELLVIRHGQASFGADDYDQLSNLGHDQSAMAGEILQRLGWVPDRVITGTLTRQIQTLASMGFKEGPEQHAGFNEYDFDDLLSAKFNGKVPDSVRQDRKTHFRTLREVIYEWQAGGLPDASESWLEFSTRVQAAREFACQGRAERVLVISSGGVIGQLVATCLGTSPKQMVALNLQVKNTSMTRFFFSKSGLSCNEFNSTPQFSDKTTNRFMTYS